MSEMPPEFNKGDILIVDDTPTNLRLLSYILQQHGYRVRVATNGMQALSSVETQAPEIILLDVMMPGMDGFEVCSKLKENPSFASIPVLFISALERIEDKVQAFQVGGADYITKPFQPTEVLARVDVHLSRRRAEVALQLANQNLQTQLDEIQRLHAELQDMAVRDVLTGVLNRRYLTEFLPRELARANRESYPVSVIMMDIDHFKNVNDTYGHSGGDVVLQAMGRLLKEQTRREDIACRYGGEEFVVVMSNAGIKSAFHRADDLRQELENMLVEYEDKIIHVTMSMGVANYPIHGHNADDLLRTADNALYTAKNSGRNCVISA